MKAKLVQISPMVLGFKEVISMVRRDHKQTHNWGCHFLVLCSFLVSKPEVQRQISHDESLLSHHFSQDMVQTWNPKTKQLFAGLNQLGEFYGLW